MRIVYISIFICLYFSVNGQDVDSLKVLYQNEKDNNTKIKYALEISEIYDGSPEKADSVSIFREEFLSFIEDYPRHDLSSKIKYFIGSSYYQTDTSKLFAYLKESAEKAFEDHDSLIYLKSIHLQASKLRVLSKSYEALDLLLPGLQYVGNSNSELGIQYKNKFAALISTNYIKLGMFEEALTFGHLAEQMAMKSADDKLLLRAYFNLGTIYGNLSSDEKKLVSKVERARYNELAHDIIVKAYDLSKDMPMSRFTGISCYNLGVFYSLDSQYVRSRPYLKEAVRIGKELPFKELLFNAYNVMADDLIIEGKLDSADLYITNTEKIGEEMGYPFHQISAASSRGNYYLKKGNLDKARSIALSNVKLTQDKNLVDKERQLFTLLFEIEEQAGNYKLALEYFKRKEELAKQISGEATIQKIELLQAQFNHEKQKNKIQKLEKDKYLQELKITRKNRHVGIAILLGLIMSIFFYYKNKERVHRAEKQSLAAQQKLLRMQLNPHFLFNTLNSIQQFIYQKKEPRIVADYLSKFSQLVRRILHNSKEEYISLSVEIEFLKDYLDLQQLRFDTPFRYKINVDNDLDQSDVLIPPMFTQPFVENSIEHGNLEKISTGIIEIDFVKKKDVLEIVIKDNGVGIEKTQFKLKNDKHRSLATKITQERLQTMKPKMKRKSKLEIIDLSNFDNKITGTQVILNLPLLYK